MADFDRSAYNTAPMGRTAADIDAGLRAHMVRVYNYMFMAMAISGAIAYFVGTTPALYVPLLTTPLKWVAVFAPLGIVFMISARLYSMSFGATQFWFWAFAVAIGVSISSIFIVYDLGSIFRVFLITSVMFGAMSLYGYTTKTDLSKMRSFLVMGIIGLILASLVNLFWPAPALHFAISVIGVLIFTVLTAVDTQGIKESYFAGDSSDTAGKKAIMGALQLYISFVNIFMFLLSLLGGSRD